MIVADVPPTPQIVIVEDAATRQPSLFLGFMAVGAEDAMRALERAAWRASIPIGRTKNDKNETEVMVLFPVGSDRRVATSLFQEALSGKFGKLKLEVTVAPQSAFADGKLDFDNEVTAEPPESIIVK
jgi:hypothetical protein